MSEVEASGGSVDEAVESGLALMGLDRDQVEVEVLSVGPPGSDEAKVRISARAPEETISPQLDSDTGDGPERQEILEYAREDALDFLEGLLEAAGLDGEVEVRLDGERVVAEVFGEDLGILIGRHGIGLQALQELLRAAVQRQAGTRVPIDLDIEGYRERRGEVLREHAEEMVAKARRQGEVVLEVMPAYERKIIHDAVSAREGVTSFSEGEEPNRRVVIRALEEGE